MLLIDATASARQILDFVRGIEIEDFWRDDKSQSAMKYKLVVMGEVASRLSQGFRSHNRHIPWAEMIDRRDVLLDLQQSTLGYRELWQITSRELPSLLPDLELALSEAEF